MNPVIDGLNKQSWLGSCNVNSSLVSTFLEAGNFLTVQILKCQKGLTLALSKIKQLRKLLENGKGREATTLVFLGISPAIPTKGEAGTILHPHSE